mgnify:CR=1 FL=1
MINIPIIFNITGNVYGSDTSTAYAIQNSNTYKNISIKPQDISIANTKIGMSSRYGLQSEPKILNIQINQGDNIIKKMGYILSLEKPLVLFQFGFFCNAILIKIGGKLWSLLKFCFVKLDNVSVIKNMRVWEPFFTLPLTQNQRSLF